MSSIFDGDGVHAVELGDVGDGVGPVAVVLDMNFSFGSGVGDDLDGELGLSGFRAVHRKGSVLVDFRSLQARAAGRHLAGVKRRLDHGLEGGTGDVLVCKQDVDGVLAGLCGQVGHGAGSITIVLAFNLGLTGSLHRQAQTTGTGSLCINGKGGWFTYNTTLKTGTIGANLEGKQANILKAARVRSFWRTRIHSVSLPDWAQAVFGVISSFGQNSAGTTTVWQFNTQPTFLYWLSDT